MRVDAEHSSEKSWDYYTGHNDHILELLPEDAARFLDVGCAAGVLGQRIKASRSQAVVHGVDSNEAALAEAGTRLDRVFDIDLNGALPDLGEKYDCVICGDVLEHLIDPWSVLRWLAATVPVGGHVVASIPNIRYYKVLRDLVRRGRFRYQASGILDSTHLRFFTLHEMRSLFSNAGLEVIAHKPRICGGNKLIRILAAISPKRFQEFRAMQYTLVGRKL